jgi:hypothetical protein
MNFDDLVGKTVCFNKLAETQYEIDFDEGMLARVISVEPDYGCGDVVKIFVDHTDFIDHNRKLMKPNYYDKDGLACLTWEESGLMRLKETIYVDKDTEKFPLPFDVLDEVPVTVDDCLDVLKMVWEAGNILMENENGDGWNTKQFRSKFDETELKARNLLIAAKRI